MPPQDVLPMSVYYTIKAFHFWIISLVEHTEHNRKLKCNVATGLTNQSITTNWSSNIEMPVLENEKDTFLDVEVDALLLSNIFVLLWVWSVTQFAKGVPIRWPEKDMHTHVL